MIFNKNFLNAAIVIINMSEQKIDDRTRITINKSTLKLIRDIKFKHEFSSYDETITKSVKLLDKFMVFHKENIKCDKHEYKTKKKNSSKIH